MITICTQEFILSSELIKLRISIRLIDVNKNHTKNMSVISICISSSSPNSQMKISRDRGKIPFSIVVACGVQENKNNFTKPLKADH